MDPALRSPARGRAPAQHRTLLRIEPLEPRVLLTGTGPTFELFNSSPALFAANMGQWQDASVRYAFQSSGGAVLYTDAGPVFCLSQSGQGEDGAETTKSTSFSVTFEGSNAVSPVGQGPSQAVYNYYVGDEANWRGGVPTFQTVAYTGLWSGIDLLTSGRHGGLKYEFHVAPGADPGQIGLHYDGIEGLSLDVSGALHIATPLGDILDDAPIIYQEIGGQRVQVAGAFRLLDSATVGFSITGAYDPQAVVVIDPELAWSSYIGGSGVEVALSVAADDAGNVFIAGGTASLDFPTAGGFVRGYGGGANDSFLVKLSGTGDLLWSTYIGGSDDDCVMIYPSAREPGLAIDADGNVLMAGFTESPDFPVLNGFDTTCEGADAYVARVSGAGELLWSTLLGGSGYDRATDITVDSTGSMFVAGETSSSDFPGLGGFDTTIGGTYDDGFVAKLSATGELLWSTFLGGSGYEWSLEVATDDAGNVFAVGNTRSSDFPILGAFDATPADSGAFVAKVSSAGDLLWSSYLDGGDPCITVDAGNAIVACGSMSLDFYGFERPTSEGLDLFVLELSGEGEILWSRCLLCGGDDIPLGMVMSQDRDIFIAGGSSFFVVRLTATGDVSWLEHLGGSGLDWCTGVAIDPAGDLFLTGMTGSASLPALRGFDTVLDGPYDGYVAKIHDDGSSQNRPPSVALSYPTDGLTTSDSTPSFQWAAADNDGDSLSNTLYISADTTPFDGSALLAIARTVGDATEYTLLPSEILGYNNTYSWGVTADDGHEHVTFSDVFSFTVTPPPNVAPTVTLGSPNTGTAVTEVTPRFTWAAADGDGDTLYNTLYVSTDSTPFDGPAALTRSIGVAVEYTLLPQEALAYNNTYWWGVTTDDGHGHLVRSDVRWFTGPNNLAPVVSLNAPEWGVATPDTTPRFDWTSTDQDGDFLSNTLYVSSDNTPFDGSAFLIKALGSATEYTLPSGEALPYGSWYWWGVKVDDGHGHVVYNTVQSLNVQAFLKVVVYDGYGNTLPYVQVQLKEDRSAGYRMLLHTDGNGEAIFRPLPGQASFPVGNDYRLRVDLKYQPPWSGGQDYYVVQHSGVDAYAESKYTFNPADLVDGARLNFGMELSLITSPQLPIDRLNDLASSYFSLSEFFAFTHDVLNWHPRLDLPLAYSAYETIMGWPDFLVQKFTAIYRDGWLGDNEIHVSWAISQYGDPARPVNREWHEASHYMMDDAIGLGRRDPLGDANHGGFFNHCTGDSWSEGWAMFWPLALRYNRYGETSGWSDYMDFGLLERNFTASDIEERAVCGVLVDLIDSFNSTESDYVKITIQDLWNIIGKDPLLDDFKDVYDALARAGVGGGHDDPNGLTDLDNIFRVHGFFVDKDRPGTPGYRVWNPGEEIGRAAEQSRPDRTNTPHIPSAYLSLSLADPGHLPPGDAHVELSFSFPAPWQEYDGVVTRPFSPGQCNLVYLDPGPEDLDPTVSVRIVDSQGAASDVLQFTMGEYREMLARAQSPYCLAHEFRMTSTAVMSGRDVFADALSADAQWLAAYIELDPGETAADIDLSLVSVSCANGAPLPVPIAAASDPGLPFVQQLETTDRDADGRAELAVKLPLAQVMAALGTPSLDPQTLTIAWTSAGGAPCEGTATTSWPSEQMVLDSAGRTRSYLSSTGALVTMTWKGAGSATISRPFDPRNRWGDPGEIRLSGSDAKSALAITIKALTRGQPAVASVGDIIVDGSLGSLSAPATDLRGNLNVTGALGRLTLRDVAGRHTLTAGTDPLIPSMSWVMNQVQDATLTSATPFKSLSVSEWLDTDGERDQISTPWIGNLVTRGSKVTGGPTGDFEASLTLNGVGATKSTLAKAAIAGSLRDVAWDLTGSVSAVASLAVGRWVENATIVANGPVGKVSFGGMKSSSFLVGAGDTILPDEAVDFLPTHCVLSSFALTGIYQAGVLQDSFIDSDVAAWTITKASVRQVELDNSAHSRRPFGFAAETFTSFAWQQGASRYRWPLSSPADMEDFEIRDLS